MKRQWLIAAILGALLVGSSAFASVARLTVMGTQPVFSNNEGLSVNTVNGSLWYDDEYNVFFNPSYVNDYKNYATINKGMEGGWFSSMMETWVYGVYVNRGGNTFGNTFGPVSPVTGLAAPGVNTNTTMVGSLASGLDTKRPVDFFIGSDTGVKWGLHAAWAYNRDEVSGTSAADTDGAITNRYWHIDLGAQIMGFEPFVGWTFLSGIDDTRLGAASNAGEQNLDEVNFGFRYKYESWTPYFVFHKYRESASSAEEVAGATTGTTLFQKQIRFNAYGFGAGHDTKVTDGVHIMKNIGFYMNFANDDFSATEARRDYTQYVVPLNLAIEAEALSWLVLRAGFHFDIWNEKKAARTIATGVTATNRKLSEDGLRNFRIGSTMKFSKLQLHSAFGNGTATAGGTNTSAAAGADAGNLDSNAIGFDSQLFAVISASYNW